MLKWLKRIFLGIFVLVATVVLGLLLAIPYSGFKENDIKITSAMPEHYWMHNLLLPKEFTNVSGISISGEQTFDIEIKNGVIVAVIPSNPVQQNSRKEASIDLKGNWLFPGLIDLHVHVFDKSDFAAYLSHGVTSIRNMMGFAMHLKWREQINSGEVSGPNFITASPTINAGGSGGPFHKYVSSADEVANLVNEYKEQGFDFIKFYDGLDKDMYSALSQTANSENFLFAGHPPHRLPFDLVLSAGPSSIEHIEELFNGALDYDLELKQLEEVIRQLKHHDIPVVTTFTAYENIYLSSEKNQQIFNKERLNKISPMIRFIGAKQLQPPSSEKHRQWIIDKRESMRNILSAMAIHDVPMVLGTDTGPAMTVPGQSVLEEMRILHDLGISTKKILSMATKDAAKVLNIENLSGFIKVGERADLIVLSANPVASLDHLGDPTAVLKGGEYYDHNKLNELQEAAKQHQSVYHTLGYFLNHLISML